MKIKENKSRQLIKLPLSENKKGINNHIKAATHLKEAARFHLEAAEHHHAGNHKKASYSTILAQGHVDYAINAQKEDIKHHALIG